MVICFRVTSKTKINFVKNQFRVGINDFDLPNAPIIFTFPSNKILKLKIEELFRLLIMYTDTQKKHTLM